MRPSLVKPNPLLGARKAFHPDKMSDTLGITQKCNQLIKIIISRTCFRVGPNRIRDFRLRIYTLSKLYIYVYSV
jgi:hypothetical protein